MKTQGRGRLFGAGVSVGIVVGFLCGSLVGLLLGDEVIDATSHLVDRVAGRHDRVNFELLLQ